MSIRSRYRSDPCPTTASHARYGRAGHRASTGASDTVRLCRSVCRKSCSWPDDPKEVAEQIMETRTIRTGRDAWDKIGKAESFEAWKSIGAALAIGKHHALKVTGANAAWGQNYSREFGSWMKAHGFGSMPKATRSWAVALHENAARIEQWRSSLSERERKRLINPQSVVRRWQRETRQAAS